MAAIKTGLVTNAPCRFAVDVNGQVYNVNGIDQPFVWNGVATSTRNWGIAAPPAPAAGSTSGTGLTGTYSWRITWYNENTGEYGAFVDADQNVVLTDDGYTINRPSTAGIDSQITHWRLWRTTAGQATVYYLVTTETTATASYVDNEADTVISANDDLDEHWPPDGKYPFVKFYKGRYILYGSRVESTGTVAINSASANVAGTNTNFRASHVGQRLYIAGQAVFYTIASVTNATTATITPVYAAANGSGLSFRILPARPSDVAWSQADSEGFDRLATAGVFPADGDLPTGLEVVGTSLVLFKRSHAYLFDYGSNPDPLEGSGNISLVLSSRGLIRQECCVPVGLSSFCLDAQGIYQFDGAGEEQAVDQAIRRLFHPDDEIPAAYRINRAYSDQWHGVYDQRTDSVHFFVTTGSETVPKTGLVFSRERMQWTMNKYEQGIKASCQGRDANGEYRAWVGDENGWVWALSGTRQCEGNSSGTFLEGSVTASGNTTLTNSAAAWPTTGNKLKGVYVKAIAPDGTVQTRLITDNTGTELTITPAWSVNPLTTYTYVIGGVESIWRSVWHFIEPTPALNCKGVELLFLPASSSRYIKVRLYKDFGSSPVLNWGMARVKDGLTIPLTVSTDGYMLVDASFAKGRVRITFPEPFSTCFSVELAMLGANKPTLFRGYDLEAVSVPKEFE